VKVWSLQSFFDGGFIKGRKATVMQDQTGSSIIVAVKRKINGEMVIDPSYEVYAKQVRKVKALQGGEIKDG